MEGVQVTFFTLQNRRHGHQQMHEWLMSVARSIGIHGATSVIGAEGIDHAGTRHSAHFFELADQPIQVTMVITSEQAEALFKRLEQEHAEVFYVRSAVEFGVVGRVAPEASASSTGRP